MKNFISIENLSKVYAYNFKALDKINLEIEKGEIFALLGPNGAGKSTLINIICGIITSSAGKILVNNFDIKKEYRKARSLIGVVPQELTLEVGSLELSSVRAKAPHHFFLVPGVGAQGGDLNIVCENALNESCGLLINMSRSILYAGSGHDFDDCSRKVCLDVQKQMETILRNKNLI